MNPIKPEDRESGLILLMNHFNQDDAKMLENTIFGKSKSSKNYRNTLSEVHCFITQDNKNLQEIMATVEGGQVEWNHPKFRDIADTQNEIFSYIQNPFEVVDGIFACPKCGNTKTVAYSKQTRSCDEGMSTFVFCINRLCKHQWMYRG